MLRNSDHHYFFHFSENLLDQRPTLRSPWDGQGLTKERRITSSFSISSLVGPNSKTSGTSEGQSLFSKTDHEGYSSGQSENTTSLRESSNNNSLPKWPKDLSNKDYPKDHAIDIEYINTNRKSPERCADQENESMEIDDNEAHDQIPDDTREEDEGSDIDVCGSFSSKKHSEDPSEDGCGNKLSSNDCRTKYFEVNTDTANVKESRFDSLYGSEKADNGSASIRMPFSHESLFSLTSRHSGAFQPLIDSNLFKTDSGECQNSEIGMNGSVFKSSLETSRKSIFSKSSSNPTSREPSPRTLSPLNHFSPVPRAFLPHLALNANREPFITLPRPLGFGFYSAPHHPLLKKEIGYRRNYT